MRWEVYRVFLASRPRACASGRVQPQKSCRECLQRQSTRGGHIGWWEDRGLSAAVQERERAGSFDASVVAAEPAGDSSEEVLAGLVAAAT